MNEVYWVTRLDAICDFLTMASLLGFASTLALLFIAMMNKCNANDYEDGGKWQNYYMKKYQTLIRYFKRCGIATFALIFINVFIPTKNDALLIYGVGGTIDYIKSNDTAKQLPDKCIKALDKWVDSLNEDNKQKRKR